MVKRDTEQLDVAEVEFEPGDWAKGAKPLRYVALRITPLQTNLFQAPQPKCPAVVTNRSDLTASELIQWHRQTTVPATVTAD
jgi:hypothetical protein